MHGRSTMQGARRAIFTEAFLAADSSVGLIVGPQACGKSVVAAQLVRDPQTAEMYPDGVLWVHCGAAATAWSVLRQLWQIVRRVRLGSGSQPLQWLSNPAQCAPVCPYSPAPHVFAACATLSSSFAESPAAVRVRHLRRRAAAEWVVSFQCSVRQESCDSCASCVRGAPLVSVPPACAVISWPSTAFCAGVGLLCTMVV